MCLDEVFLDNCQCTFSPYGKHTHRCSAKESEKCIPKVAQNFDNFINCKRGCKTPCDWKGYTGQRSNMNFPSDSFTPYLLMDILDNKADSATARSLRHYLEWWKQFTAGSNITYELSTFMMLQNIRRNFAYIHIYMGKNKEVCLHGSSNFWRNLVRSIFAIFENYSRIFKIFASFQDDGSGNCRNIY